MSRIGKPHHLRVFVSKKTIGSKQNRLNIILDVISIIANPRLNGGDNTRD